MSTSPTDLCLEILICLSIFCLFLLVNSLCSSPLPHLYHVISFLPHPLLLLLLLLSYSGRKQQCRQAKQKPIFQFKCQVVMWHNIECEINHLPPLACQNVKSKGSDHIERRCWIFHYCWVWIINTIFFHCSVFFFFFICSYINSR